MCARNALWTAATTASQQQVCNYFRPVHHTLSAGHVTHHTALPVPSHQYLTLVALFPPPFVEGHVSSLSLDANPIALFTLISFFERRKKNKGPLLHDKTNGAPRRQNDAPEQHPEDLDDV